MKDERWALARPEVQFEAGPDIFLAAQLDGWNLNWHCVEIDSISGAILKSFKPTQ